MGWYQQGAQRYYYRSLRRGRLVRRVYIGAGPVGELAAAEDRLRRAQRELQSQALRAARARLARADAQLNAYIRLTDSLARAALMNAGYFRHARGHWRRKRTMTNDHPHSGPATAPSHPPGGSATTSGPATPPIDQPSPEQLADLVRRAEQGDHKVLPALRRALADHPEVWQRYGDLGDVVEATWLNEMGTVDRMMIEAWRRKVAQLKAEIAGDAPSPLEQLLARRIGAAWIQCQHSDLMSIATDADSEVSQANLVRRQDAAHRRFLQAIQTLAVVRRLLRPSVSPVQVASRLGTAETTGRRRTATPAHGVGVSN